MKGVMKSFGIIAVAALVVVACDPEQYDPNGVSKVDVRLTDAPCGVDEVNIDIQSVELRHNDTVTVLTAIAPGVYNLLDLNNGIDTLIASGNVSSGNLQEIRLILGSNNTIMVDSAVHDLTTPSAQQSGLKVKINEQLVNGVAYSFTLDFDACRSIVKTGNGKYILKPVVRVFTTATTGGIEGVVQPDSAVSYTFVVDGVDTIGTIPNSDGYFLINGVSSGTYDVEFEAAPGYTDYTETGVVVTTGQFTDLDTIHF